MTDAIDIIQREHRAIAAVVHCLHYVVKEVREEHLAPDFELFHAIVHYIQDFPDRFHHPKENDYLFDALAKRSPGARKAIHDLMEEHEKGEKKTIDLQWKLEDWEKNPDDEAKKAAFLDAADEFVDFQRKHIGHEEQKIIPAAREHLTQNDWRRINEAFGDHEDPIFGDKPKEAFDHLFAKIVALAPEPIGTAPRKAAETKLEGKDDKTAAEVLEKPGFRHEVVNLHWI